MAIRSTASLTATQQECVLAKPYVPYDGPIVTRKDAVDNGSKVFFDGRVCKHGHISQFRLSGHCCECINQRNRKYKKLPEYKARRAAWMDKNREKVNEQNKMWRVANPSRAKEIIRKSSNKRRAASGSWDQCHIDEILWLQNYECNGCGDSVLAGFEVDHVMPLSLGGKNTACNIQALCIRCNRRKWAMHPDDWDAKNGKIPEVNGWQKFQQLVIRHLRLPIAR